MYASRWLLAPIYMGLSLAVLLLGIKLFQEAVHIFPIVLSMKEADNEQALSFCQDSSRVHGMACLSG